ncbi:hypothetical protein MLD52_01845 [Puniceicoccaceae bacterium K14]|nr:hypothetical protein [Puniceicoccaceae bacterium K14]
MLDRKLKQENFIDRKRKWKSGMDRKMGPGLLITVLPAIVMCVFLLMAAPYLRVIIFDYLKDDEKQTLNARKLDLSDAPEKPAPVVVPGNPEHADAEFYRKLYDEQGIDWREAPVIEVPEEGNVEQREIAIKPLDVEIPSSMMKTVDYSKENSE